MRHKIYWLIAFSVVSVSIVGGSFIVSQVRLNQFVTRVAADPSVELTQRQAERVVAAVAESADLDKSRSLANASLLRLERHGLSDPLFLVVLDARKQDPMAFPHLNDVILDHIAKGTRHVFFAFQESRAAFDIPSVEQLQELGLSPENANIRIVVVIGLYVTPIEVEANRHFIEGLLERSDLSDNVRSRLTSLVRDAQPDG